jgi:hypothetical protein
MFSAGRSCRFWALEMGWAQAAGWKETGVSFAEKVIWYRPPPMLRLPGDVQEPALVVDVHLDHVADAELQRVRDAVHP